MAGNAYTKTWGDVTQQVAQHVRKTVTKIDHEAKIAQGIGEGLKLTLAEVLKSLKPGDKFTIPSVGTFHVEKRGPKRNFNPNTGQIEMLPERTKIIFKAASPIIENVVKSTFKDVEAA